MNGELAQGAVFAGDYRVVRKLAQGGMGAVYEAEQLSTAKRRALKVMLPQLVADPQLRARFEQEAKIGARIASEHIVEVVGAGVDAAEGMPWLAMELLEGETLDAAMRRRTSFAPVETARVFEQLCHALGAAHDVQVVHRDLKPENVFLARSLRAGASEREVKVLDFGIAKIVHEGANKTTAALGTPLWLAPEQMQGQAFPSTDVWALGLIAYWMLAGSHYWRATDAPSPSLAEVLEEISVRPIEAPSLRAGQKGRALPHGFDAWFAGCVTRDPRARFQDARAALAALLPVLSTGAYGPSSMAHVSSTFAAPPSLAGPQSQAYDQTQHASVRAPASIMTPPPGSLSASSPGSLSQPSKPSGCGVALTVILLLGALAATGVVLLLYWLASR